MLPALQEIPLYATPRSAGAEPWPSPHLGEVLFRPPDWGITPWQEFAEGFHWVHVPNRTRLRRAGQNRLETPILRLIKEMCTRLQGWHGDCAGNLALVAVLGMLLCMTMLAVIMRPRPSQPLNSWPNS